MLTDLPPEILSQIIAHAPTARALRDLSLTCRTLHQLVEEQGWKGFVLNHFPSFNVPPHWKDAAHALATLSRNWDRRAILARDLEPFDTRIHTLPQGGRQEVRGRWKRPHGQTMGYQPVVDSYEEWTGNDWSSRKEVVVWGAGAKLMMKSQYRGKDVAREWQRASKEERDLDFDHGRNRVEWVSYLDAAHVEGRDDITTVNILRPEEKSRPTSVEDIIVGRANGELKLLHLATAQVPQYITRNFETGGSLVRSADVSRSHSRLLVACLGDARAVLYPIHGKEDHVLPISEVKCVPKSEHRCRTWSSRFLSPDRLAIGRGVSKQLVYVYEIQPHGLSEEPIRTFGSRGAEKETQTSAYPIATLPESSSSSDSTGNVFLSGGYDGYVRVHDMRSPSDYEALLSDPTDYSAIFSLVMVGRERVVAGGAINGLLKVFDIRMAGGRVYHYLDLESARGSPKGKAARGGVVKHTSNNSVPYSGGVSSSGSNIFTSPYESSNKWQRRSPGGPVYSLSRPSSSSTSLYVGRENSVMHFNFTSMMDKHPDPVFEHSLLRMSDGNVNPVRSWDPLLKDRVLRLSMYDQTAQGNFQLKVQRHVGRLEGSADAIAGYDERWSSVDRGH